MNVRIVLARGRKAAAFAVIAALCIGSAAACASLGLGEVVQAPHFDVADREDARLRLVGPSAERPLGGAAIRIMARVENPNPFGFTLTRLAGDLFLENSRAAQVDFPLGLPLEAGQATVVPIELVVGFSDLPGLADALRSAISGSDVPYRLDGTVSVDAGPLGRPSFGPSTLLRGDLQVHR